MGHIRVGKGDPPEKLKESKGERELFPAPAWAQLAQDIG